ncbi:MAG: hypothetical protein SFW62_02820 [Alphaproteobacteria bacterium]|nr:hypothetical protein [Alphaproteobacteria bacterium]
MDTTTQVSQTAETNTSLQNAWTEAKEAVCGAILTATLPGYFVVDAIIQIRSPNGTADQAAVDILFGLAAATLPGLFYSRAKRILSSFEIK